jgi:prepilin-type N-terminal cleavage/methylation domain-containing protein
VNKRGFTLFEVIVAIAIVMMLMSTMAETIKLAFEQKRSAEYTVANIRDIQTAGDVFVQEVGCAVIPSPLSGLANSPFAAATNTSDSGGGISGGFSSGMFSGGMNNMNNNGTATGGLYLCGPFQGDNTSLSFYCSGNEPHAAIPAGVRYIEYKLAQQPDNTMALVRGVDTNLLADPPTTVLPQEVLITNVKSIQIQYYDGTGWINSWDSMGADQNNVLPTAVKLVLTLEPLRDRAPERVITRVATILCAQKTITDYNNAAQEAENANYYETNSFEATTP